MKNITKTIWVEDGTGEETMAFPARRIVCPCCHGEGKHDHPAFSNGLTEDDYADPYFNETYLSGAMDVRCEECKGLRVVDEIDYEACTENQKKALDEHRRIENESYWERYNEQKWGY